MTWRNMIAVGYFLIQHNPFLKYHIIYHVIKSAKDVSVLVFEIAYLLRYFAIKNHRILVTHIVFVLHK